MNTFEMQQCTFDEEKAGVSGGAMRFKGYLAFFDNVDSQGDVVMKGAFLEDIERLKTEEKYLPILENHGGFKLTAADMTPLGYFETLEEDDKGLRVGGVICPTTRGKDMYALLKTMPKGSMAMSIGYSAKEFDYPNGGRPDDKGCVRRLKAVKLHEGSLLAFPSNKKATVDEVKSEALRARVLEKHLKEGGLSNKDSVKVAGILKNFAFDSPTAQLDDEASYDSGTSSKEDTTHVAEKIKKFTESIEEGNRRMAFKYFLKKIAKK